MLGLSLLDELNILFQPLSYAVGLDHFFLTLAFHSQTHCTAWCSQVHYLCKCVLSYIYLCVLISLACQYLWKPKRGVISCCGGELLPVSVVVSQTNLPLEPALKNTRTSNLFQSCSTLSKSLLPAWHRSTLVGRSRPQGTK